MPVPLGMDQARQVAFRPVDLQADLELLHGWMHEPHVIPYWQLNHSLEWFRDHLERALQDPHQTLYLGLLNGVPMSYWECYWAVDDVIGRHYPAQADDQGIHLLIGPPRFVGQGLAQPLLRAVVGWQFQYPGTERIIAEPDCRNTRMIQVFRRCGFEPHALVDLPDKRALLMLCHRRGVTGGPAS